MAYATLDELVERMGLTDHAGDTSLVARLTDALDAATGDINDDTGRNFAQRTSAKTFTVTDGYVLRVPDFRTVSTLKVDDDDDGVFETTIASTGYELDKSSDDDGWPFDTIRLLDRTFPTGGRRRRRVEVTADWGWTAVPSQINKACTLLAARLGSCETVAVFGVQSFGPEGGGAYVRTNDPDYRAMIGRFVKPQVA